MKPIKGYEGLYSATETGKIISHKRARLDGRVYQRKVLKQMTRQDGYKILSLCKNGDVRIAYIHQLVAKAFIPNPGGLATVNHKDGNKANNHYKNLEWCSLSDNLKHAYSVLGLEPWNKGRTGVYSKENLRRMSEAQKKRYKTDKAWNKGKKMSAGFKEKARERQLGLTLSDKTKKRLSESMKRSWKNRRLLKNNLIEI